MSAKRKRSDNDSTSDAEVAVEDYEGEDTAMTAENGEDCSSEGSESAVSGSEDEEGEENIEDLPPTLVQYGWKSLMKLLQPPKIYVVDDKTELQRGNVQEEKVVRDIALDKVEKAFLQSRQIIFALHPDLSKLSQQLLKRLSKDDGKVPPGSAAVERSLVDNRFVLCHGLVGLARIEELRGDAEWRTKYIRYIKEALMWYPRHCEACFLSACAVKVDARTKADIDRVEFLLRKAASFEESAAVAATTAVADEESEIISREAEFATAAKESLALLLCQEGRPHEATKLLEKMHFKWRLSRRVLCYAAEHQSSGGVVELDPSIGRVFDSALPMTMIDEMCRVFRADSPYWSEHSYDAYYSNASRKVGYFSYLYPCRLPHPKTCELELLTRRTLS